MELPSQPARVVEIAQWKENNEKVQCSQHLLVKLVMLTVS